MDMNFGKNLAHNYITTTHVFEKNRNLCSEAISKRVIDKEVLDEEPINWDDLNKIFSLDTDENKVITYDQAFGYFKETDLLKFNEKIVTTIRKSGIFACFKKWQKSRLRADLINGYNLLFLIAKCPYQRDNKTHVAMQKTIYDSSVLDTNVLFSWENIGFQSNLPWTDLRGIGMLGVLHLLYICTLCPQLRDMLYELSTTKSNRFTFAIVSLNMTRIVLKVIRREQLNRDMNKNGVFSCANKLYIAIFLRFGQIWTNQGKTISDVDSMLKELDQSSLSKRGREIMV